MQIIDPTYITDSTLISCDIPAATSGVPEWDATVSYITGQRVSVNYEEDGITPGVHVIYECTWHTPENLNLYPPDNLTVIGGYVWWSRISATERWKLFDMIVAPQRANASSNVVGCDWESGATWEPGTVWDSTTYSSMQLTVQPGIIDSVALMNLDAGTVSIIMDNAGTEVYNETQIPSTATYCNAIFEDLPSYVNATTQVIIRNYGGDINVGEAIFGKIKTLGKVRPGVGVGITDYSVKQTDAFGGFSILERAFSKRVDCNVMIATASHSGVMRILEKYRSTPLVWIISSTYSTSLIYGYYRDFKISIPNMQITDCSLSIEGLGGDLVYATPIPDPWVDPWDGIIDLTVPGVPTVAVPTWTKIEEAPVSQTLPVAPDTLNVPAVPVVVHSSRVFHPVGTASITNAEPGVVTCTGHGLLEDAEVFFYSTQLLTLDVAPGGAGWAVGDRVRGVTSGYLCVIWAVLTTTSYRVYLITGTPTSGEVLTNETATADQGLGYPTVVDSVIPLPLVLGTHYWVMYDNANSFRLSLTIAGSQIDTTTDATGEFLLYACYKLKSLDASHTVTSDNIDLIPILNIDDASHVLTSTSPAVAEDP